MVLTILSTESSTLPGVSIFLAFSPYTCDPGSMGRIKIEAQEVDCTVLVWFGLSSEQFVNVIAIDKAIDKKLLGKDVELLLHIYLDSAVNKLTNNDENDTLNVTIKVPGPDLIAPNHKLYQQLPDKSTLGELAKF